MSAEARERFAAAAMQAYIGALYQMYFNDRARGVSEESALEALRRERDKIPTHAWKMADAMVAAEPKEVGRAALHH